MNERAKLLSEQHWNGYIKPLLRAHGQGEEIISVVGFHYLSAFQHGHRHGVEDQINREYEEARTGAIIAEIDRVPFGDDSACDSCANDNCKLEIYPMDYKVEGGLVRTCSKHRPTPSPGDITNAERERIVRCLDRNMSVEVERGTTVGGNDEQ